jgi:hypothetical protein
VSQRHFISIYTDLQNPVFGNLVRRGRQIEDLAGFSHPRFQQPRTALIADRRRCVGNDVVGTLGLLGGMPFMPLLHPVGFWPGVPNDFGLGLP